MISLMNQRKNIREDWWMRYFRDGVLKMIIKKVLPADLKVLFLWVELNVHQYVEVMHFIWEIT